MMHAGRLGSNRLGRGVLLTTMLLSLPVIGRGQTPVRSVSGPAAVLVAFHSARCGPCRQMEPVLADLIDRGAAVRQVDVNRERSLAERHAITQTPTYLVMRGGRETLRLVGVQDVDRLTGVLAPPARRSSETKSTQRALTTLQPSVAPRTRPRVAMESSRPRSNSDTSLTEEPMPSLAVADAIQRARTATVRLRVHDGHGYGVGTGTVIDVQGDEALVLTCGHLFRGNEAGRIEVDVFAGGSKQTVTGQLIDFDAKHRDIALVAMRPGVSITPVQLSVTQPLPEGSVAFSFGCDRGKDPSRRDTRIIAVDKFNQQHNSSNYEIDGAPIDGRSGGGLFDQSGRLIGVCNAADYDNDTGIYAGPGEVRWQLDRVDLARLYQTPDATPRATIDTPPAINTPSPAAINRPSPAAPTASDDELIVIVRSRSGGPDRVVTIEQPSPALMAEIARR